MPGRPSWLEGFIDDADVKDEGTVRGILSIEREAGRRYDAEMQQHNRGNHSMDELRLIVLEEAVTWARLEDLGHGPGMAP